MSMRRHWFTNTHPERRPPETHILKSWGFVLAMLTLVSACTDETPNRSLVPIEVDTLIVNAQIFSGADEEPMLGVLGITDDKITLVAKSIDLGIIAHRTIDAVGCGSGIRA